jgi:hypothetical protein
MKVQTDRLTPQQMRDVLHQHFCGHAHASTRVIAGKLTLSRSAVQDCLTRAAAVGLLWPLSPAGLTDEALERLLLPPPEH